MKISISYLETRDFCHVIVGFTGKSHGNLRYPPKATPQYIRPYYGTISHWFPLIRPAIRAGYFLGETVALGGVP